MTPVSNKIRTARLSQQSVPMPRAVGPLRRLTASRRRLRGTEHHRLRLTDGDEIKPSCPRRRESSSSVSPPCRFPAFAGMTNSTNAGLFSSPPVTVKRANPDRGMGNRRGALLLIVLVCLLLAMMIGGSLLKLALTQRQQIQREELRLQSAWLAESAIDRAASRIRQNPEYAGEQWDLPAEAFGRQHRGSVRIEIKAAPGLPSRRYVTVVADYPSGTDQRARVRKRVAVELSNEVKNSTK